MFVFLHSTKKAAEWSMETRLVEPGNEPGNKASELKTAVPLPEATRSVLV